MDRRLTAEEALEALRAQGDPAALPAMARYGIPAQYGNRIPQLRALARRAGRDHDLAQALWSTGVHEARLLATMVADPARFTEEEAERWALDLRSWDLCDGLCLNLLRRTPFAWKKAGEWPRREEELVRRAGFSLIAVLAVHDKAAPDARFLALLPLVEEGAGDGRNLVRKAVSWALRQVGKRDLELNAAAVAAAERLRARDDRPSRWVASDALRELRSGAVQARLRRANK